MSYILDALRKSEKDRKRDEVPILHTIHSLRQTVPAGKQTISSKLLLWTAVLLTGCIVLLGVFFRQDLRQFSQLKQHPVALSPQQQTALPPENITHDEQEAAERQEHEKALIASRTVTALSTKAIMEKDAALSRTVVQEPAPLTITQEKDAEVSVINRKSPNTPTAAQLPLPVQSEVGKMKFAGHVYAEDASGRMIMINNKILREGDVIDIDFRLQEITRSGVVLVYKSTPFRVDLF